MAIRYFPVLITVALIAHVTPVTSANDPSPESVTGTSDQHLRGEIVDSDDGQLLPARLSIRSSTGAWYFPKSVSTQGTAIEYRRQVSPTSLEQHVTLSAHPFEVELPAGKYTITVERGKEYLPQTREVVIEDKAVDVSIPLKRWINMASLGWYSGDVHAHRTLSEVPNLVLAEDLNVAMPLSHWVTSSDVNPTQGNRITAPVPPPKWIRVDATHGIYPLNTEYEIFSVGQKPHTLGAVLILGERETLDQGALPVRSVAGKAHQSGAFLDLEKHSWAWTPMIVPMMKPELFELVNNHCWPSEFAFHSWTFDMASKSMNLETNSQGFTEWGWIEFGLKSYYAYLNCGFRMMPSAGTGSGVHPVPLGFGRVYVQVPGEFRFEKWREGLLAGRSFVTTGPLMQVTFNNQPAGHRFVGDPGGTSITVNGIVQSLSPIHRIEILVNGNIVRTLSGSDVTQPEGNSYKLPLQETIPIEGSSWLAVRCFEARPDGRIRFAHSAPVFIDVPGKPQSPYRDEVNHFIERMEREVSRNRDLLSPEAFDEYQQALSIYRELQQRSIDRPVAKKQN
jgi:hypothetical protein